MAVNKSIKKKILAVSKNKFINTIILGTHRIIKPVAPDSLKNIYSKFPVKRNVKVKLNGSKPFVMVNDGSDTIANEIYWRGVDGYEHLTMNIYPKLLKNTEVFFDIGANTGLYSLIAGVQKHNVQTHAFEPVDTAFNFLAKNIRANQFNNITANQIALSDFDGESEFNLQMPGDSNIPLGSSLRKDMGDTLNRRIIKVKTMKLDTYVNDNNVNKIDLIKVDTEGTEDKVIEGGKNSIDKFRPVFICEVLSNTNLEEKLHALMDKRDYNYYYAGEDMLEEVEKIAGDPYIVSNYLLVPKEKAALFLGEFKITKIKQKVFN